MTKFMYYYYYTKYNKAFKKACYCRNKCNDDKKRMKVY